MSKILRTIKSHIPAPCPKNVREGAKAAIDYDKLMKKTRQDRFERRFATTSAGYFPEIKQKSFFKKLCERIGFSKKG